MADLWMSCDGCGPTIRATHVWAKNNLPLTFCGHCDRLQAAALMAQGFECVTDREGVPA